MVFILTHYLPTVSSSSSSGCLWSFLPPSFYSPNISLFHIRISLPPSPLPCFCHPWEEVCYPSKSIFIIYLSPFCTAIHHFHNYNFVFYLFFKTSLDVLWRYLDNCHIFCYTSVTWCNIRQ